MSAALETFTEGLARVIGNPTDLRPFVCNGSPLECSVFIVGLNPASEMKDGFWGYWRSDFGFDKASWFERYKIERRNRPLKPGRSRRNEISNTRRVMERLIDEIAPIKALETNVFAKATEQYADLAEHHRATAPLDFLVRTINPTVIVVHGKDASEHIQSLNTAAHILEVPHFSRGWSHEKAAHLGSRIRQLV